MSHFYFCTLIGVLHTSDFYMYHREIKILVDLFNQIRKKLVIFVHFKGFNSSQKPPLSYFAQKTSFNLAPN